MGWREEYDERVRKANAELDELIAHVSFEDLKKRFLRDFGCMNCWDEKTSHEYRLASEFHKRLVAQHPEEHKAYEKEPYRCYHVTGCSCGFCSSCDSSD